MNCRDNYTWTNLSSMLAAVMLLANLDGLSAAETAPAIDRRTLDKWSAPYRGWHYWPDHVIASDPRIPGSEKFKNTDVPCVYQPWLVEHRGRFFNFYNAANGGTEQTGLAFSADLIDWMRYPANPVIGNRPAGYDAEFASDPKVFRDGDHWTMFYFGVGRDGAHIMAAFSLDLVHWTDHPEPLYKAGGNPSGLDTQYAHKISLLYNPGNETFYLYYCACGSKGRGIGLITSKPIPPP